jgi:hypothetical protein
MRHIIRNKIGRWYSHDCKHSFEEARGRGGEKSLLLIGRCSIQDLDTTQTVLSVVMGFLSHLRQITVYYPKRVATTAFHALLNSLFTLRDFRLPPRYRRDLRSSGILRGVGW